LKRVSSFDRRADPEQFQRTLLERDVLLESVPTVEAVTAIVKSEKTRERRGVTRVQITVSEQTIPSNSLSKAV
jgi:hypothetical protein